MFLYSCNTAKKVPDNEFLLTKNKFVYEDQKYLSELPNYVSQKPNKKQLFVVPFGLLMYNLANSKYDSILNEYMTYPNEMRNQKLRDSLFMKYEHPEYQGKTLFWNRFAHTVGEPPVILDDAKTESSAENIKKRLVYRGFWDGHVEHSNKTDSASKKAEVVYQVWHNEPTKIDGYYYNIPDPNIKDLYERNKSKTKIKNREILDQTKLEDERKRLSQLFKDNGYYRFNTDDIFFTADTLATTKQVPLVIQIHKDSEDTPYKKAVIGDIDLAVVENGSDFINYKNSSNKTTMDSLRGIRFHTLDDQYKTRSLWRAIVVEPGGQYDQKKLDQTKKNILAMNNFSILTGTDQLRDGTDDVIDVKYILKPLPKYELKVASDISYSQLLNLGLSPSIDLTSRNLFGGAENLTTSISATSGFIKNPKNLDKRILAYEASVQGNLSFPRLLLPFKYYKLIPKRYSPTSSINLGASIQENIGLGRINFNTGLNYNANVNDIITHRLTLFNTQLSLTRNRDQYYSYFPSENAIREAVFADYFNYNPTLQSQFQTGAVSMDEVSNIINNDSNYQAGLDGDGQNALNGFKQSLINKERQTQDVLVSSFIYNYIYNELSKNEKLNPFYFNGKIEVAGNIPSLFAKKSNDEFGNVDRQIFGVSYSQFVKLDFDVRKYFRFFEGKHTLALRQFVGIGIPYGNSSNMPFIRSYYNGGSNDIRAWVAFGGLGPADSQLDERVRTYMMDNVKLTTSVEYRVPFNSMFEGAVFTDMGNIWSLKNTGLGDEFKFNKFLSQVGVGSGLGLRVNVAYITLRVDLAYKMYDPNRPNGQRWVVKDINPLKPTLNFAFGYPF